MFSDIVTRNGKAEPVTDGIFPSGAAWIRACARGDVIAAVGQAGPIGSCQVMDSLGRHWDSGDVAFGINPVGIVVHPQGYEVTWMRGPVGATYGRVVLDLNLQPLTAIQQFQSRQSGWGTSQGFLDVTLGAHPVMVDDTPDVELNGVRGGYPITRGHFTVVQSHSSSDQVLAFDWAKREIWIVADAKTQVPSHLAIEDDGTAVVVIGGTGTVVRQEQFRPWTAQAPTPVDVPRIGRGIWLTFFEFDLANRIAPSNGYIEVKQGAPWLVIRANDGRALCRYVAGNPDGDTGAIERAIAAASGTDLEVAAYVPKPLQDAGYLPPCRLYAVEFYRKVDETEAEFEARGQREIDKARRAGKLVILLPQVYSSNATNTADLRSIPAPTARLAQLNPDVVWAIAPFSGSGRATGYQDHSEVHGPWIDLAAGITGPGLFLTAGQSPETPKPPAPKPAPTPEGLRSLMPFPKRCALVVVSGAGERWPSSEPGSAISVPGEFPRFPIDYRDVSEFPAPTAWQVGTLNEHPDKHLDFIFDASGRMLTVEQNGTLSSVDPKHFGAYQQLAGGITPSGEQVVFRADGIGPVFKVVAA